MDTVKAIFWNSQQRRLRTFWRLVLFFVVLMVFSIPVGMMLALLAPADQSAPNGSSLGVISNSLVLVAVVGAVWFAGRFLDRRRFRNFGLHLSRRWWQDFGFGLLLGGLLMTGIFLVELAMGWVTVTGSFRTAQPDQPFALALIVPIVLFTTVGINEEILFRGYFFKNLAEGLHLPRWRLSPQVAVVLTWVLTSAVFGWLHGTNPNATLISTVNIMLAGIWLAVGYVLTGELAIPIGTHISWNFFQGNVFSFPVSGTTPPAASFITLEQGGPPIWTGGNFGPEAGLLCIIALIVGTFAIVGWVRMRSGQAALQTSLAEFTPRFAPRAIGVVDGEVAVMEHHEGERTS